MKDISRPWVGLCFEAGLGASAGFEGWCVVTAVTPTTVKYVRHWPPPSKETPQPGHCSLSQWRDNTTKPYYPCGTAPSPPWWVYCYRTELSVPEGL